jgi:hypothetical protein
MSTLDVGIAVLRSGLTALGAAADRGYELYDRTSERCNAEGPLCARALDRPPFNSLLTLR